MAGSMLKECVASMKDILMCAVCLEDLNEPRMLVCHHSFCTSCLESIQLTGFGFQRKLQCPKCRKYSNVPRGIVNSLPLDCKLIELSEIRRQAARFIPSQAIKAHRSPACEAVVCASCAQPKPEGFTVSFHYIYCSNCRDYLCNTCSSTHKDIPVFKDHELICLAGKGKDLQREACLEHSMKYKDYYCEECTQFACSACVSISHREHAVRPYEQYDKVCRDKVYDKSNKLSSTYHVPLFLPGLLIGDSVKPFMACLDAITEKTSRKIGDAAKTITKDIERQRDELLGLVKEQQSKIKNMVAAHILRQRCHDLWCSLEPGKLLKEYEGLLEEVDIFLKDTADVKKGPELKDDSDLYDGFRPKSGENSLGSLTTMTIKGFMSEHKLARYG